MILTFRIISSWNCFEYLCQSTQRRISCNTFFLRSIPLELHLELNSRCFFHLYRSLSLFYRFYSRCAPFRAWKRSKPGLPPYRSPLSAVSSTCKEITWDKCYGSVRLALFTASWLRNVVWNCALGKWQCLHNETSVTRSTWIQAKATLTFTSEVS